VQNDSFRRNERKHELLVADSNKKRSANKLMINELKLYNTLQQDCTARACARLYRDLRPDGTTVVRDKWHTEPSRR
jgi:hypothetical protein